MILPQRDRRLEISRPAVSVCQSEGGSWVAGSLHPASLQIRKVFNITLWYNLFVYAVYVRMFAYDVPATVNGAEKTVVLISYEQQQFEWAADYLQSGSLEAVQNELNTGLTVFDSQGSMQVGNKVTMEIDGRSVEIEIAGLLSASPFNSAGDSAIIICSEDAFRQITGEENYICC